MDIRMTYDNISQAGDFVVTKGDLATDRYLETAVLISLFTEYIEEALQWLLDQHIARAVTVTCTPDPRKHQILAEIDIARNGQNRRYQYVWRQLNGI